MSQGSDLALLVAIGAPRELVRLSVDKDGLPTALLVIPRDTYETDYGTFKTPERVLRRVLAAWKQRGLPLPIDYEHQSAQNPPVEAPAAGLAYKLEIRKEGLVATSIKWTARAKRYLVAASDDEVPEYNFSSPVFLFDKKTMEPTRLISLALTNTPASHNQDELRAQVAARVENEIRAAVAANDGGPMHKEFLSSLCYMLKMRATDTYKDLRTAVEKILTIIPDTDDMLVAAKAGGGEGDAAGEAATILSLAGLVEAEEVERLVETRLSERPVAPDEVLTMLALGADADLASVTAAVLSLKNPVGMVPRSELDRATARIAELDEKAGAARIDELVASNSTRVTPALEPEIRELARSNFALAQATVAKLPEQKPEKVATQPPPVGSLPDAGRANMSFHGGEIEVDPDSATLEARVEAHRKASAGKFKTYIEAYADLKKQGAA